MKETRGRKPMPAEQRKSERIVIMTTRETRKAVESQAQNQDTNVSGIVRAALVEYLRGTEDAIK